MREREWIRARMRMMMRYLLLPLLGIRMAVDALRQAGGGEGRVLGVVLRAAEAIFPQLVAFCQEEEEE